MIALDAQGDSSSMNCFMSGKVSSAASNAAMRQGQSSRIASRLK